MKKLGFYNPVFHLTASIFERVEPSKALRERVPQAKRHAPLVITQENKSTFEGYFLLDKQNTKELFPKEDVSFDARKEASFVL